jgi:hypothetical protein
MSRNQIEIKQVTLGRKEDLPAMVSLDCSDHTIFSYAMRVTRPIFLQTQRKEINYESIIEKLVQVTGCGSFLCRPDGWWRGSGN